MSHKEPSSFAVFLVDEWSKIVGAKPCPNLRTSMIVAVGNLPEELVRAVMETHPDDEKEAILEIGCRLFIA